MAQGEQISKDKREGEMTKQEKVIEGVARLLCEIDGYSGWYGTEGNEGMTQAYLEKANRVAIYLHTLGCVLKVE
jgi:hypothetical protein